MKKRVNQLIESQSGALNRYFLEASSVDAHDNNQTQESHPEKDDDQSLSTDHEVNE
jgi:hypothetical protein